MDYTAAFDLASRTRTVEKLAAAGAAGKLLELIVQVLVLDAKEFLEILQCLAAALIPCIVRFDVPQKVCKLVFWVVNLQDVSEKEKIAKRKNVHHRKKVLRVRS